ncbi:MAG: hypothetical protein ACREIV_06365, partial [Planctomycetaceae bacterium]
MQHSGLVFWGTLLLAGLLSGCQTPSGGAAFSWLRPPQLFAQKDDDAAAKEEDGKDASVAEDKTVEAPEKLPETKTAAAEADEPPSAGLQEQVAGKLDAETLRLMQEELQATPEDERPELFREWKDLDPAMVRQVISIRQMTRQMVHESLQEQEQEKADEQTAGGTVRQVSAEQDVGFRSTAELAALSDGPGRDDQPDDPGFGGPSPWEGPSPKRPPLIEPNPFEPGHSQLAATETSASSNPVQLGDPGEMVEELPWVAAGPSAATTQTPNTARSVPAVPAAAVETLQPPSPMRPPGATPLVAEPASAPPADWSAGLETLIALAEADVAALPPTGDDAAQREYIEKHVWLRMLYLMAGRPERAIEHIPHINAADQEFWQQVFLGLAGYFDADAVPDPGDRASQTAGQLRAAVQSLQRNARLELRNLA